GETPNMLLSVYEYDDTLLVFETRGPVGTNGPPAKVTNEFFTSEGVIRGGKFYPNGGGKAESVSGQASVTEGGAFGSFIAAMRSRSPADNNADAETAHYSAALCHLGNISFRLGQPAKF